MNCPGCNFNNYPRCAVQAIKSAIALEDILDSKPLKKIIYPVCHKNAQSIKGGVMIRTDACDNCGMCDFLCNSVSAPQQFDLLSIEKMLVNNLNRLNMVMQVIMPEDTVATEVKAKGNARVKRIDLVIKTNNAIYLVKLLNDLDKYPYYSRSYSDMVGYYNGANNSFAFKKRIVVTSDKKMMAIQLGYDCINLTELIEEIR